MTVKEIVAKCNQDGFFIGDNFYALKTPDGIIISSNHDDFINVINKKENNSIIIREAQYGGMTGGPGFPSNTGIGIPQHGASDNFSVRDETIDGLLDKVRSKDKSLWEKPVEKNLEEYPLYGHTRNEKDWNLRNYRLTQKERANQKNKDYLKRLYENRRKAEEKIESNSVKEIKSIPINPNNYTSSEEKLSERRHQEDNTKKRPYHGPESEFVYYPNHQNQLKKTAAKVRHTGLSSIFENDPDMGNDPYPAGMSWRARIEAPPWSSRGYTRERDSFNPSYFDEENQEFWMGKYINNGYSNDKGGKLNIDLRMNSHGKDPGEIEQHVVPDVDMNALIKYLKQNSFSKKVEEYRRDKTKGNIEKQLENNRYPSPPYHNTELTYYDISTPYPFGDMNFFSPSGRRNQSGQV